MFEGKKHSIAELNAQIDLNLKGLIWGAEKNFSDQIDNLVYEILNNNIKEKAILLAGPSCAGKTTFAEMLKEKLKAVNISVVSVNMDNFFITRAERKRLPSGEEDMETINIVNLKLLESSFKTLFKERTAMFPAYNFQKCVSEPETLKIDLPENSVVLLEGIHVLNPKLYKKLGTTCIFKVFISNYDTYYAEDTLNKQEIRFIRRMVRDAERRNTSPRESLENWDNQISAENKFIMPYEKQADFVINSSHVYEMGLYRDKVEEIVKNDPDLLIDLPFLNVALQIHSISTKELPEQTLMYEFVNKPNREESI